MLAANTIAFDHLGTVTHTDLLKLDAHAKQLGQFFDQLAKINTPLGCKIKNDLRTIKRILTGQHVHFKLKVRDLADANMQGIFGLGAVILDLAHIRICRLTDNATGGKEFLFRLVLRHTLGGHTGKLGTSLHFHNNIIAPATFHVAVININDRTVFTQTDLDQLTHI